MYYNISNIENSFDIKITKSSLKQKSALETLQFLTSTLEMGFQIKKSDRFQDFYDFQSLYQIADDIFHGYNLAYEQKRLETCKILDRVKQELSFKTDKEKVKNAYDAFYQSVNKKVAQSRQTLQRMEEIQSRWDYSRREQPSDLRQRTIEIKNVIEETLL